MKLYNSELNYQDLESIQSHAYYIELKYSIVFEIYSL